MASPNDSRHHSISPQHTPLEDGTDDWRTYMHDSPPILDNTLNLNEPWFPDSYSPTPAYGNNDFLNGHSTLYSFGDNYLPNIVDYNTPHNALGLTHPSPHVFDDVNYYPGVSHVGSPAPRNLPQIITDVPSTSVPYSRSPRDHSPYNLAAGQPPLSAATSTPSSTGYPTVPMTPTSLPPSSHLGLPAIHPGLLSPHSPYPQYYSSQFASSPKSPSAMSITSPSTNSPGANYSDDDGHLVYQNRRIPLTVQSVIDIAARFPHHEWIIPQRTYRPNTQSDRRRYVEEVQLEAPIMFYGLNGETCGIYCREALTSKFSNLAGRDDPMFENRGPSVSIRLMWPGYAAWSRQIPTRDFRSPPQPITRAKLAKNVAKTIQRFLDEMKDKPMEEDADPRYKVGGRYIKIEDLELVGLQHVSMGSWQAHLRLRRH